MTILDLERFRILKEIDLAAARRIWNEECIEVLGSPMTGNATIEAGIHKARCKHPAMTASEKRYSRRWLRRHGFMVPE